MLYTKILELQEFSVNPSDVLEDQFDPQTDDYVERRKLLKQAKGQIKQSSTDLDNIFNLVDSLEAFKADIRFIKRTSFNTEGLVNLCKIYGKLSTIFRELSKSDKKLQRVNSYKEVYSEFSKILDFNFFDMFNKDLEELLLQSEVRNKVFNKEYDLIQKLDTDKQIYIESFKEGSKV